MGVETRAKKRECNKRVTYRHPLRGHKDEHGAVRRVLLDGEERRLVHGQGACREASLLVCVCVCVCVCVRAFGPLPQGEGAYLVEGPDVRLQRHRTRGGVKVEGAGIGGANPLANLACVEQRVRQHEDAVAVALLRADVPHARGDDLHGRSLHRVEVVHLVHNEQLHLLHVLPSQPPARQNVPLLRRAENDVTGLGLHECASVCVRLRTNPSYLKKLQVNKRVARQPHHSLSELLELLGPVLREERAALNRANSQ